MKKLLFIFLFLSVCMSVSAQTVDEILQKLHGIRNNMGNVMARNYLLINHSKFTEENKEYTYLAAWTSLTANMWHENPSDSLRSEYKKSLELLIDKNMQSESFVPTEAQLSALASITRDYCGFIYEDGNKELALHLLKCIHRWYAPYPKAKKNTDYARYLSDLCFILREFQKYDEWQPLLEEHLEVSKDVFGEKSAQYARALYLSASSLTMPISEKVERINEAISIYEVADGHDPILLKDMKKTLNNHTTYMTGVANTANLKRAPNGYYEIADCQALVISGLFSEALESLLFHKNECLKQQPLDTIKYSKVINNLINAYLGNSEIVAAQKEIEEFNSTVVVDNLPTGFTETYYSSAGHVALRLRDYPKALNNYFAALKITEKRNYINYCAILSSIALTYRELAKDGDYEHFLIDAKWYIDESISIFEEKVGPLSEHGEQGLKLLNNKAYIYDAIGERGVAIDTFEKIYSEFQNDENVKGAWTYVANNLASMYLSSEKYDQCISILEDLKTDDIEMQDGIAQNLVLAYFLAGKSDIRQPLLKSNDICRNNCLNAIQYFSESELENYWTYNARTLMYNNTVAEKYPKMADVAFDNALFTKGLTLMSSEIIKDYVVSENKPELTKLYNRVKELRQNIKYKTSKNEDILTRWRDELQEKERVLIQSIPNFKERIISSFSTWKDIKRYLQNDEIAIEFVYMPMINDRTLKSVEIYYGALILSNDDDLPHFITLGENSVIEKLCSIGETDALSISDYYNNVEGGIYETIWKKLEPYLKGKNTIYFSPTGALNSINHDAILTDKGQRFAEKYNLVRLSTTSKITSLKQDGDNLLSSAAIYGGINYDESIDDMRLMAKSYTMTQESSDFLALRAEDERGRWNLLTGTKEEIDNIEKLFNTHKLSPKIYSWNDANEESFKALDSKSPAILHLSTHGFFMDTKEKINANPFMRSIDSSSSTKDDMLLRTGLLLSGANNVWTGKGKVNGIEDGILTADEISRLDLKKTKLVVLSACETAKGHIDEVDGVLGLQRAFKKAGAGSIVMSLWKVPDHATSILMTSFYENLLEGKDARTALKEARKYLMNQNDAYKNPYYWAAFVVLD